MRRDPSGPVARPSGTMTDMNDTRLASLDGLAVLRVAGADADAFLQGQLSNDIQALSPERAQLSSYNSPKGRVLAVLHVFRHERTICLLMPRTLLEPVSRRLRMYVLRARVELAESSLTGLGLWGGAAAGRLGEAGLPAPEAAHGCAAHEAGCVIRWPGETPRFALFAPPERLQTWRAALTAGCRAAGFDDWRREDILAGLPSVHPETQDRFVAQMLNLDSLGAISFRKGCYTGQEVIARTHYLGKSPRRMHRARIAGPPPAPGTAVRTAARPQAVGHVVEAVSDLAGGALALAVLRDEALGEPLQLDRPDAAALHPAA